MKKLLLFAALCLIGVPATRVWAQTAAPEAAQSTVSVVGEVVKPGVLPFLPGENAVALLERAGGANAAASISKIYLLREGVSIPLDLAQSKGNTSKIVLREGDVLVVPKNLRSIAVVGAVVRPGSVSLPENKSLSVLHALVAAGGPISSPDKIKIFVLRANSENSVEGFPISEDLLSSFLLKEGDVVYLPPRTRQFAPDSGGFTWPLIPNNSEPAKLISY